jgi:molybdate transport system substrate-binding protein
MVSFVLSLAILSGARAQPAPLTVSAAVSLTEALQAIADEYAKTGGGAVRFNFAGSNTLARQLLNGAPADVFVSADEAQMDVAVRAGAIDASTRVDVVGNRLAIVVRPGTVSVRRAQDLTAESIRRIGLGDPAAVPAGVYARRYLEAAGLWSSVETRVIPVGNVRAVLAAVMNGSAEAGIVYESDALIAGAGLQSIVIDDPTAPQIHYPGAIVSRTTHRAAAERFLAFLRGPEASAIFARFHFTPLSKSR